MSLLRSATFIFLAAALAVCAQAGVARGPSPVYTPPSGAWAGPLGAAFADPALSGVFPLSLTTPNLIASEALRAASPLVVHLTQSLSLTPESFAALPVSEKKGVIELASEAAREEMSTKAYELAERARVLSVPGKTLDREARADLYGTLARLMEMRDHYGAWLDEPGLAQVEEGYKLASKRAWEARNALIGDAGAPLGVRAPPAAARPDFKPSPAARRLRQSMSATKSGWGQSDFDALYTGYGFILRQGGKHRFYAHPDFPQLHESVSRQNDLPPGYAQSALKLIAELERLTSPSRASEQAASGPPAILNLADLEVLLSQPAAPSAKSPPRAGSTLAAPTPRLVEKKAEPPHAPQIPSPRGWFEKILTNIVVEIPAALGGDTPQAGTGFDRFGVAQSDASRESAINAIQAAVDAFVRRAESIESLAGFPDAQAQVRVLGMTGGLLPPTWGKAYSARVGIFPSGLDFAAVDSARAEGFQYADVSPHPVELSVQYSVRSKPTTTVRADVGRLRKEIDALRKEIYREYGVHIVLTTPQTGHATFSLPRDAIVEGGLREHFKIVKMVAETRGRAQITSRRFLEVANDLGYNDGEMSALAGKDVLTVGEGGSDFGKSLESRGAAVTAADWWYGMTVEQIDRYLRIDKGSGYNREIMSGREALSNLPRRRIIGRLPHLPVSKASFDETAVNQLIYWLNGMDPNLADASLRDLIRVTRPGGRVRIGQVDKALYERFAKILAAELPDAKFRYAERGNDVLLIDLPKQSPRVGS